MNYRQTIDYLYDRLPLFSRVGAAAIKRDLDNTKQLCALLGDPHKKFKSIHVAGTNGKGSVCHMLAAIFQTAGYKTGLYTSPHLKDFRERIKVDGREVEEEFIIEFTAGIKKMIEEIEPSFFEVTVAMAFDYFAKQAVDIAIIETGLGGRLDSTNIITPELSIITNIGRDHMNLLGDSIQEIAFEKAGIIKSQVPVVIGEVLPETLPVFEKIAREKDASLMIATEKRKAIDWRWKKHHLVVELAEGDKTDHQLIELDLPGIYQAKNLITVLESCSVMVAQGWNLHEADIKKGLNQVKKLTGLHGRWELIHSSPAVVLDVAHNEDGIKQLLQQVEITAYKELHLVIGFVKDKEIESILSLLPVTARYYFTRAQIPRALPEDVLAGAGKKFGLNGNSYSNVNTALQQAMQNADKEDLIVVCGSVFLVGEVTL